MEAVEKRKRKNKQTETVSSGHTESMPPKKTESEPPQEKLGTLKTGQTVHFD